MKIHADFSQRVLVHSDEEPWIASPMQGVDRRPLDRVGGEVARATSIVRYAPGSHFASHVHSGGEEFLVLDGVFQDEHGDYPAGTYVRNPPQSKHIPRSDEGCTIFVKLWQFEPNDTKQFSVDTLSASFSQDKNCSDIESLVMHEDDIEQVSLKKMPPDSSFSVDAENGAEILVLSGELFESGDALRQFSWLRIPTGKKLNIVASSQGAIFWLKTGNLQSIEQQIERVKNA